MIILSCNDNVLFCQGTSLELLGRHSGWVLLVVHELLCLLIVNSKSARPAIVSPDRDFKTMRIGGLDQVCTCTLTLDHDFHGCMLHNRIFWI